MKAPALLALLLTAPALVGCLGAEEGEPLRTGLLPGAAPPAAPGPGWPPVEDATIRPGMLLHTPTGECQTNFLFRRPDNTSLFLGVSAYCVRELPIGALVGLGGEDVGVLIYSSWITMQEKGEEDENALQYHDFALVRIDDNARSRIHPALYQTGGPTDLADFAAVGTGQRLRTYQTTLVEGLLEAGTWHEGAVTGEAGEWAYLAYGLPPARPGSLGGGVITPEGKAVGVVVNLGVVPNPGANGVMRLDTAMAYAEENAKLPLELVTWSAFENGPV